MSPLDTAGAVKPAYEHASKLVLPRPAVAVSGGLLKWYDIATSERPIPAEIVDLARDSLEAATPRLDGELGFVILHRCGGELLLPAHLDLAQRERALGDRLGEAGRARAGLRPLAAGRGAPPDVLCLGAASGLPRAGSVEPLPALPAPRE